MSVQDLFSTLLLSRSGVIVVRLCWSFAVRTAAVVERLGTPSVVSELEISMEKQQEAQPDSLSTVTVKEYPPSEVYSSEPPPVRTHIHLRFKKL